MEIYETEEQQVEAIKSFFKEYGPSIGAGAVLGLSLFGGWNWYTDSQIAAQEAASDSYELLVEKVNTASPEANIVPDIQSFIDSNKDSSYAVLASLHAAKALIDKGNLVDGAKQLTFAQANAKEDSLKAIVALRLARVQAGLKEFDTALSTLNAPMPEAFKAQAAEVKGDILFAKGDLVAARNAYQEAKDNGGLENNTGLQNKLDNLAVNASA